MKAPIGLALLLATSFAAGCSTEEKSDATGDELRGTHWQSIVTCQSGGLVLNVDTMSRRHLQAVVRDHSAVAWLSAHPGAGPSGVPNRKGELVIDGDTTNGVFSPQEFQWLRRSGYSVGDARLPEATVARERDGIRVRFVTWASGHEIETSNWLFHDCR
jgi:hypothetical protein